MDTSLFGYGPVMDIAFIALVVCVQLFCVWVAINVVFSCQED